MLSASRRVCSSRVESLPRAPSRPSRGDLYALQDDLDFIKVQLARLPTRKEVWRAAMLGMLGGACIVQGLAFLFR